MRFKPVMALKVAGMVPTSWLESRKLSIPQQRIMRKHSMQKTPCQRSQWRQLLHTANILKTKQRTNGRMNVRSNQHWYADLEGTRQGKANEGTYRSISPVREPKLEGIAPVNPFPLKPLATHTRNKNKTTDSHTKRTHTKTTLEQMPIQQIQQNQY